MPDPYAQCPCGSGKKFKWCCQPIYAGINQAFQQEAENQHERALKIMLQVTEEHSGNPEAWGQLAQLYFGRGQMDDAEKALEKAFAINPNYPYGLLLQAAIRYQEGEYPGALLLARRAAEAYSPEAKSYLADVYSVIFDCEMRRNRPVAARAALRIMLHGRPEETGYRDNFEALFGDKGRLPASARRDYQLLPPAGATGERRAAWDRAFAGAAASAKLARLAPAFEHLVKQDENDAPALFNLALARAWLGDNQAALAALDRYLPLEKDLARAEGAAALAEVLRCGTGLENEGDYAEYAFNVPIRDTEAVNNLLQEFQHEQRLLPMPVEQKGVFFAMLLDYGTASILTATGPSAKIGRMGGYLMILPDHLRIWGPGKEIVHRLRDEMRQKLNLGLTEAAIAPGPIMFEDVVSDALVFPIASSKEETSQRVLEHVQKYYEEKWIHQPRRALNGTPPVDAVGHPALRKKLLGVIRFMQDCATSGMVSMYDFDRLRRKLGLLEAQPAAAGATGPDISAMGPAELSGLAVANLNDDELEQAFVAAQRLDAGELAAHFAQALAERTPQAGKDRFAVFNCLLRHALKENRPEAALDYLNDGERIDCEHNEGKRRNDYELARAQLHAKRGEANEAADVFQRLIERMPTNFRYRGGAAESMLSLKQSARALKFAEDGLTAARQANDRDSEAYLQELVEAARRQVN